jgi:penicillin-binding protein 2
VNLHRAIVESCDVFFYEVGKRLGIERISRYARLAGLGSPTGVDLPGEQSGLVPSREWKQRVRKEPWYEGETISVAIGQGPLLVTPLQLAYAVGGIASGGAFARPRLLFDPDSEPEIRHAGLQPRTVETINAALAGVVNEEGTGRGARLPNVEVGGKTGTAQLVSLDTLNKFKGKAGRTLIDNAWFVGLAPARNPEIVVAVLLEHGEHGASAAPLARDVIKSYYDKKQPTPRQELARGPQSVGRGAATEEE